MMCRKHFARRVELMTIKAVEIPAHRHRSKKAPERVAGSHVQKMQFNDEQFRARRPYFANIFEQRNAVQCRIPAIIIRSVSTAAEKSKLVNMVKELEKTSSKSKVENITKGYLAWTKHVRQSSGVVDKEFQTRFLRVLSDCAVANAERFNPQQIQALLVAHGASKQKPPRELLQALEKQAIQRMGSFDMMTIQQVLWAFCNIGISPQPELLDALMNRAASRIDDLHVDKITSILSSLALLKIKPRHELVEGMEAKLVFRSLDITATQIGIILSVYVDLEMKAGQELVDALMRQTVSKANDFSAQAIGTVLWSFSALGIKPTSQVIRILQEQACIKMHSFRAQNLSHTIAAFADFGLEPDPKFVVAFKEQALTRIKEFNPKMISSCLVSIAQLRLSETIGERLVNQWKEDIETKLNEFTAEEVTRIFQAFGTLGGSKHARIYVSLGRRVVAISEKLNPDDISIILWSHEQAGMMLDRNVADALSAQILLKIGDVDAKDKPTILSAFEKLNVDPGASLRDLLESRTA